MYAPAQQANDRKESGRDEPVIGHRLARGYMAVHAPGQPCRYCDDCHAKWQPSQASAPPRRAGVLSRAIAAVRKRAAAGAVLTVGMVALAVQLGGGVASAASGPAPMSSPMAWNSLTLINGWQPGPVHYAGTGDPQWAVSGGIVYLSGSVLQTSAGGNEFAVLPVAARPAHKMWITVYTVAGTQGYVTIDTNGAMYASSSPQSNAQGYTSLAGLSFPAQSLATHKLALLNTWQSSQSAFNSGDPAYSASHGVVYLSGSLNGGDGPGAPFAVLPSGLRPARIVYVTVYTYGGTIGLVEIDPDGTMYAYDGDAPDYTSLAGVSFPVASVSTSKLTLLNGWASADQTVHTGDPAFSVRGGIVYLSGSAAQQVAGSGLIAVLPAAARPAHDLFIAITVDGAANVGTLNIEPNGDVYVYSSPSINAQRFSSLAGVSYPVSS